MCDPWAYEKQAWANGYAQVVGVDEVGRGPLAGPVVAAAVSLPQSFDPTGIRDSKIMTPKARDAAYERIVAEAVAVGVGIVSPEVIDRINILQATHTAMRAALNDLSVAFDFILIDGRPVRNLPVESLAIVKGDSLSVSISAASIVAKVTRDRIMLQIDREYPEYGFASHKGYGSRDHIEAINKYGPCPYHRKSFAPVAERIHHCPLPGLG
ncbi:MAG: ribonuclease HII [Armatimonadota bacterium]|jgi:ribonuclease HII